MNAETTRDNILMQPRPSRRHLGLAAIALGLLSTSFASTATAQDFPSKPMRLLLPYGAGGIGDLTARVIAQKMGDNLGQQLIIDNRAGAGGVQAFLGGLRGYEVSSWNAVSVRAGTPRAVVERLNQTFVAAITAPEVTQKLRDMHSEPCPLKPAQTRELMVSEIARWRSVIQNAHITPN